MHNEDGSRNCRRFGFGLALARREGVLARLGRDVRGNALAIVAAALRP